MAHGSAAGPVRRAGDLGRCGGLNRERVRGAALELVDREGLQALSMRRLGTELGVEAMALYRYAPSKEALLEGLVETLYRELEERLTTEPGPATAGTPAWRAELHRIARATYDICLAHPHAVPLLATRVPAVPPTWQPTAVLRDHERVLRLLRAAGLDDVRSAAAFQALTAWLLGYVSVELRPIVDDPDEPDPAFRLGLHRLSALEMPTLRETATALAERGGPDGLAAGLDALLDRFTRE
ncbi:TetR/AcrR family transcriptional regulator C-terminal domain-containing protein [Streptomyces coacervatus]|uniref:TetR/AcrR family transcriptional regulator C-terminal domain-containing protein n=1 Tax=Streptomyces coacervatus TaxID=647381 RepID=A0ABP7IWP9_9ACTN|nr:TetR/AcrR family transcriptional regulator [Streptomyces coacervatus]MDF2269605.1 TetR family transcriptional regulator [Streptomyces coacervatus]